MAWDARFWVVNLDTSWALSCDIRCHQSRCHFSDSMAGRSPTKQWPDASGPWYLPYSISLFTSYGYGKNNVQTNHMCDCPYRLHIDVVGTAGSHKFPYSAGLSAYHLASLDRLSTTWHFFHKNAHRGGNTTGTHLCVAVLSPVNRTTLPW